VKLSKRLAAISDFVPIGTEVVADIGADHGKLLVSLIQNGQISRGIAGEVRQGPMQRAAAFVRTYCLQDKIDVRLGDGLAVIANEEVNVIVIAGMGGLLISSILTAGSSKLTSVQRLILQPNTDEYLVRQWLAANGWDIVAEDIIFEDNIYYEIIVAERVPSPTAYLQLPLPENYWYPIGPLLWKQKHPLLIPKQQQKIKRLRAACGQLRQANTTSARLRLAELETEINNREQVIGWMEKH
jgi:tRNA (adenine22-N1)-methyltransferase